MEFLAGLIIGLMFWYANKMEVEALKQYLKNARKDVDFWRKYSEKLEKEINE